MLLPSQMENGNKFNESRVYSMEVDFCLFATKRNSGFLGLYFCFFESGTSELFLSLQSTITVCCTSAEVQLQTIYFVTRNYSIHCFIEFLHDIQVQN